MSREIKEVTTPRIYHLINHIEGLVERLKEKPDQQANINFYSDVVICLKKLTQQEVVIQREKINHQLTKELYLFMLERIKNLESKLTKYETADEFDYSIVIDETYTNLISQLNTATDGN